MGYEECPDRYDVRAYRDERWDARRNSDGVWPVCFLNTVLKLDFELYPTCSAMSSTVSFAIRVLTDNSPGFLHPVPGQHLEESLPHHLVNHLRHMV